MYVNVFFLYKMFIYKFLDPFKVVLFNDLSKRQLISLKKIQILY